MFTFTCAPGATGAGGSPSSFGQDRRCDAGQKRTGRETCCSSPWVAVAHPTVRLHNRKPLRQWLFRRQGRTAAAARAAVTEPIPADRDVPFPRRAGDTGSRCFCRSDGSSSRAKVPISASVAITPRTRSSHTASAMACPDRFIDDGPPRGGGLGGATVQDMAVRLVAGCAAVSSSVGQSRSVTSRQRR